MLLSDGHLLSRPPGRSLFSSSSEAFFLISENISILTWFVDMKGEKTRGGQPNLG